MTMGSNDCNYSIAQESDMCLIGLLRFLDPPKASTRSSLDLIRRQSISSKVLTGDNDAIACNVCRQVGLQVDRIVLGCDLDVMSDEEVAVLADS
jgi:Mg2+-importing ATPase